MMEVSMCVCLYSKIRHKKHRKAQVLTDWVGWSTPYTGRVASMHTKTSLKKSKLWQQAKDSSCHSSFHYFPLGLCSQVQVNMICRWTQTSPTVTAKEISIQYLLLCFFLVLSSQTGFGQLNCFFLQKSLEDLPLQRVHTHLICPLSPALSQSYVLLFGEVLFNQTDHLQKTLVPWSKSTIL